MDFVVPFAYGAAGTRYANSPAQLGSDLYTVGKYLAPGVRTVGRGAKKGLNWYAKKSEDFDTFFRSKVGMKRKYGGGGRVSRGVKRIKRSGGRKDYQASTGGAGVMRSAWRRKRRLSRKAYRRKLYNASTDAVKFRSYNCFNYTVQTPVNLTLSVLGVFPMIGDTVANPFWKTAGGLVSKHFEGAVTDFANDDLFVRGGMSTVSFLNTGTLPMTLTLWKLRTKAQSTLAMFNYTPPGGTTTSVNVTLGWDPTLPTGFPTTPSTDGATEDWWRNYKFWGQETVILQPSQTFTRVSRIRSGKMSVRAFEANDLRDFWLYQITDQDGAVQDNLTVTVSFNLSFTGDRTA